MPDSPPAAERRSVPSPPGPAPRPSGLPIFSTEPLTAAERERLRTLRRHFLVVAELLADIIELGRVDQALNALQEVARHCDGKALALAATLGSGR